MISAGTKIACWFCGQYILTVSKDIVGTTLIEDIGKYHLDPPQDFLMVTCSSCKANISTLCLLEEYDMEKTAHA